jgi:hypothetical protein
MVKCEVVKRTLKLYSWVPSHLQVCSSLKAPRFYCGTGFKGGSCSRRSNRSSSSKRLKRDKDSLGKSIHELPKPLLSELWNRLSIANQQGLEVESEKSTHALAQARRIVHHFFR